MTDEDYSVSNSANIKKPPYYTPRQRHLHC